MLVRELMHMTNLLTSSEVQTQMRISEPTLRRWVSLGLIPTYKTPTGHLRFKAEDVDALLQPHPAKAAVTTQP